MSIRFQADNDLKRIIIDATLRRHLEDLDLPAGFGVPEPQAPALRPWGLRVGFVVDLSGVLWDVAQRR